MLTDNTGAEIKVGDYLIFAVVHNRTARLRYGKVLKLNEKTVTTKAYSINFRRVWGGGAKMNHANYTTEYYVDKFKAAAFSYPELKSQIIPYKQIPDSIRTEMEKDE